ncbi:hypothetical protein CR205_10525 [Alteribacter lacisalsi]|uniref:Uncharacterized protein n=1 Tax=Alteribacter lacisalsi TaxID=2045244 RepID=A0A2W0HN26_9BACI|nr:hypothetical protein [Alteribacter lacisalsi]PYZ98975.1 hypothetical protein CR205_10525 [Alteribacter lacisalsi]
MLYVSKIDKIIKDTLNEHNLEINYTFSDSLEVPMSYNKSTNTIKCNYIRLNGYKSVMNSRLKESDENFVRLIIYRQIGHYLDFKNNWHDLRTLMYGEDDEKEELRAKLNYNAWEYGRTLVPEHLLHAYDKFRELEKTTVHS